MPPPIDVCIRGAGIVGRTLALLLARERLRVGLVERSHAPTPAADVRAYALNAASRELLESLRAWPDAQHASAVRGMDIHGDGGGHVRFDERPGGSAPLAWIADVPALEQRLAEAVRFQPLVTVLTAPQPAALTVVCEGRASETREEFGVVFDVTPYPQQAVATRIACEKPHDGVARQWFGDGEVLAFLPLGESLPGNSVAVVWSVRQERTAALTALPAGGFEAHLEASSAGVLGRLKLVAERSAWPLQLARASHWCGPGWALAGDAAHTVHPLAGQGLNLGLADARELAQVLRDRAYWRSIGDIRLLRRYERARKGDVALLQGATDGLQRLFALDAQPWTWLRNQGMWGFEHSGPLKAWVTRQAAGRL